MFDRTVIFSSIFNDVATSFLMTNGFIKNFNTTQYVGCHSRAFLPSLMHQRSGRTEKQPKSSMVFGLLVCCVWKILSYPVLFFQLLALINLIHCCCAVVSLSKSQIKQLPARQQCVQLFSLLFLTTKYIRFLCEDSTF